MKGNKKTKAAEDLRLQVLSMQLAPGSALDEAELSSRYGLSRTPLREVFQRLAGEGYVSIETNRGASVSSMDFATMRAFFQSAPMIYAAIARLAAEQRTLQQVDELKAIQRRFRQALESACAESMALHNHKFHEYIGVIAASPYLTPSLGRLLIDHTRMSHRFYQVEHLAEHQTKTTHAKNSSASNKAKRIQLACTQHDEMIEAIAQGNAAEAVDLTLQHWELSRNEIDQYVLPDPLPVDQFDRGTSDTSTSHTTKTLDAVS